MPASAAVAAGAPAAPGHIWIRTPPMPSALNPLAASPEKFFVSLFPDIQSSCGKTPSRPDGLRKRCKGQHDRPPPAVGTWTHPRTLVALLQHQSHLCLSHPTHNVAIGSTSAPHLQGQKDPRNFPSVLPFSASTPAVVPSSKHCFPIQSSHLQPIPHCSSVPGFPSHPYLALSTTHSQKKLQTYRRLTKDKEPANVLLPFQTKQNAGAEGFCLG